MGLTPLHMASGYVRPATAKILVENGADPDLRTARNERALDLIRNLRNATKETSMGGKIHKTTQHLNPSNVPPERRRCKVPSTSFLKP